MVGWREETTQVPELDMQTSGRMFISCLRDYLFYVAQEGKIRISGLRLWESNLA